MKCFSFSPQIKQHYTLPYKRGPIFSLPQRSVPAWVHLASKFATHPACLLQRRPYKAEVWTDGRKYGLIGPLHLDHYIQFRVTCNIQQIIEAAAITGRGGAAGQCTLGRLPCPRRKYKDNLIGSDTQLSGRRVSRLIRGAGRLLPCPP